MTAPVTRAPAPALTYAVLLAVTLASWVHVIWMAAMDDMAGMDMGPALSVAGALAYTLAWAVMMAAMMLPSAMPMIGLYGATHRSAGAGAALPVALFTLVYLVLWTVTGIPMYLATAGWSALAPGPRAYGTAAVLVAAGLFQFTPLKQACLRRCRSPIGFFLGHWRAGWRGGVALGWAHAVYCLGCCWALMLVLVLAGAMGLPWVLLLGVAVAAEKVLPRGERIARVSGAALVLLGLAVAIRPGLAAVLRGGGLSPM